MKNDMDYEKKYKDALEAASAIYKNMQDGYNFGGMQDLETIFPELQRETEDEDEIVIGALISGINLFKERGYKGIGGLECDRILAWLEKQDLKFKVGDLIINKDGNGKVKQILEATNSGYTTNDGFATREIYEKYYRTCEIKDICQWKPSDEQMKALYDSISEMVMVISEREMLLNSLYKDLKKLREE